GAVDDASGITPLIPHGGIRFVPGRVGQAFFFDGNSFLSAPWTGHYQVGAHDLSLILYAKFADIEREADLVDWTAGEPRRGIWLFKAVDNRFVFQSWPDGRRLTSKTSVKTETW